jgi:predicted nuclease with TOPRIM domain
MKPQEIQKINQLYKQLDELQAENQQLRDSTTDADWTSLTDNVDQLKHMVSDVADTLKQLNDQLTPKTKRKR